MDTANGAQASSAPGESEPNRDRDAASVAKADAGSVPNLRFSFLDAYRRIEEAGWSREVTERELPIATMLAGVNMKLDPGGVRELHWHKQAEWAYMLDGTAQITAVDEDGVSFVDDVGVGDLWYFPAGIPHSIEGLEEGCEFLLVFDDGGFSEDATFLLTDWLAHTPKQVLAHNLGIDIEDLAGLPSGERYIFGARLPDPAPSGGERRLPAQAGDERRLPAPSDGERRFSHRLLAQQPEQFPGGTVRIVDSGNFPVSKTVAAALVEVEPGGMRELHWHPNTDEWQYYLAGEASMTVFAAEAKARTFEYRAHDVGYVPFAMGHYIVNTGAETLRFLEMFRSERFADVSLRRWLARTPARLVADHLNVDERVLRTLSGDKLPVVP